MRRLAAVLSAAGCSLYLLGRGEPLLLGRSTSIDELDQLLGRQVRRGDEFAVYSDFAEESYVRTALPKLWSGAMRAQLLQRRLRQQFPGQPYLAAVVPAAEVRFQPPTVASLIALPDLVPVQGLLGRARDRGAHVAGMWPLSQLLAGLASEPEQTLMTLQLPSGLRHVLAVRGVAVFSRLAPDAGAEPGTWLDDAERTAQYLVAQGWTPGAMLREQVWHSEDEAVSTALREELSQRGMASVHAAPDIYQLALARRRPPQGQLLPADSTVAWRAARVGRFALAGSTACLGAAVVYAGLTEWRTQAVQRRSAAELQAAQRAAEETARVLATAQGNLGEAGLAQVTVQTWTQAIQRQPDARAALGQMSAVLARFPQVSLGKLAWRVGRPASLECEPPPVDPAAAVPAAGAPPAAAAPTDSASAALQAWANHIELVFSASLPATLPLRERVEVQQRLEAALREQGWKVRVIRPFVELGTSAAGTGLIGEPSDATMEACATVARK